MNPPLPDGEYAMPETQYIPILEECTKHGVFRNSFYNQNVVHVMMMKMTNRLKQPETVTQMCCLVMAVFFRFGSGIGKHFVRQFVQSKGTDLLMSLVQMYISEWSFTAKDALQVFLPMIGLVEVPEGRAWLYRNVLDVSEFFNHFEKNFLNNFFGKTDYYLWCSETNHFKEINRVWIHFYNEVNRMQTEQREKHMIELLKEEEREKDKKEKRLEKIKQKKEDKTKKFESSTTSEFLKSWTETSIEEEEDEDEEDDDDDEEQGEEEEAVNTCRNANAIIGFSVDQNDVNQGVGNVVYNPGYTSKLPNESSQWTNPNGEIIFDQLRKVNDEDWTTVQTKKNKEKDKQNDRQKVTKYSPSQNLKSKNLPTQKQKKKKEAKTKTVPLNMFSKPVVASSPGTVRWADIAKGATKDTPHIEANDKMFPRPSNEFCIRETTVFVNQRKGNQDAEFPSLSPGLNQTTTKEKPNKMTFHFHSDQPDSSDFGTQYNESDDEIIDIEEAEKELQKFEERTNREMDLELSVRMSHTGECFMNDPEYTDDTKPNTFDPTNLTEEEIKTLNIRGKVLGKDTRLPVSDNCQLEMNSMNSSIDSEMNTSNEIGEPALMTIANFSDNEFLEKQLGMDKDSIQYEIPVNFEETNENNGLAKHDIDLHENKTKGNSSPKSYANVKRERKTFAVASIVDGSVRLLDEYKDPHKAFKMEETSELKAQLTEYEQQVLKNQGETCDKFEHHLEMRESEHFMELIISVSPLPEHKHNIIDELFNTPGEIPEWLEDEEETPKEDDVWDEMTKHSVHIQQANATENKETDEIVPTTVENFKNPDKLNAMPKHKSPCDLLSSDPAIIHCIKQPEVVDEVSDNIANIIKKEHENNNQLFNKDNLIEPLMGKCNISSPDYVDKTQLVIGGKEEVTDCMVSQFNGEKQTAVIKPLGLLSSANPPATNCAYGQKLLENACKLEEAYDSDNSVLYPDDLDGEIYEADDEQSTRPDDDDEKFCFPSIHDRTMLSAHHNKDDVSISHHLQQLQLQQLNNYYMQSKDRITDPASLDQSRFVYYAQSAGINRNQIEQYLQGTVKVEPRITNKERKAYPVLPHKPEQRIPRSDTNGDCIQQDAEQSHPRQAYQANIQGNTEYQGHGLPFKDICQPPPVLVQPGQHMGNTPNHSAARGVTPQQVPIVPFVPYGVLVPFPRPPMHPPNIKTIQSQQAAMSSTVRGKIQEILQSMFKSKVKSVRWRNELSRIRGLPSEKLKVIGKIMIPRDENDIVCIGRHW